MSHQRIASRRFLIFIGVPTLVSIFNFCVSQKWISNNNLSLEIMPQRPTPFSVAKRFIKDPCSETTVIITSSFVPISPSLRIINQTIESLKHLHGLCPTSPVIITVDGLNPEILKRGKRIKKRRMEKYIKALRNTYTEDYHTILVNDRSLMITGNVKSAMDIVQTEFVYVLQHDLPFIRDINHTAIIKTMREYPHDLRLVRFNRRPNMGLIERMTNNTCYNRAPQWVMWMGSISSRLGSGVTTTTWLASRTTKKCSECSTKDTESFHLQWNISCVELGKRIARIGDLFTMDPTGILQQSLTSMGNERNERNDNTRYRQLEWTEHCLLKPCIWKKSVLRILDRVIAESSTLS